MSAYEFHNRRNRHACLAGFARPAPRQYCRQDVAAGGPQEQSSTDLYGVLLPGSSLFPLDIEQSRLGNFSGHPGSRAYD